MMYKGSTEKYLFLKIKLIFSVLVLTLTNSCSSDETDAELITEDPIQNKIEFKVNGVPPENAIRGLTASICCERNINIGFDHWVDNGTSAGFGGDGLNLSLDINGNLKRLSYNTYDPNNRYISPYFTPISTLNITDFELVENQFLKLKINGHVFKQTYNFNAEPEAVNIEADIEIKTFNNCICGVTPSTLTSNTNLNFHTLRKSQQGADIKYVAHTNNGYQIEFKNFTETLKNMAPGVYSFDEVSTSHRIDLRKFIGVPRAFVSLIIPQEWLTYETSGNFEILERNSENITKVKFNLIAKDNDDIVFEFQDAILETPM